MRFIRCRRPEKSRKGMHADGPAQHLMGKNLDRGGATLSFRSTNGGISVRR
jgi:hypothetical protein